jgi:hypothetical protein
MKLCTGADNSCEQWTGATCLLRDNVRENLRVTGKWGHVPPADIGWERVYLIIGPGGVTVGTWEKRLLTETMAERYRIEISVGSG